MDTLVYLISAMFAVMIKDQVHRLLNIDYNILTDSFHVAWFIMDVGIVLVAFLVVLTILKLMVAKPPGNK